MSYEYTGKALNFKIYRFLILKVQRLLLYWQDHGHKTISI